MFTLIILFGGLVTFVFIIVPPEETSSANSVSQIDQFVTDLVQLEKSSLRGPLSEKLPWTTQPPVETPVEVLASSKLSDSTHTESLQGCLTELPVDTGKHIVTPPAGPVSLICCQSTKGPLTVAVHKAWAPIGAQRFLDMVNSDFFSTKVGLFRALKGFLIQFGLPGDPKVLEVWNKRGHLQDDPSWLPLGPTNREINGVQRYQKGWLARSTFPSHSLTPTLYEQDIWGTPGRAKTPEGHNLF